MLTKEKINALKSLDLRAFLFDMDGVLYDSMPFHAKAWIYAFAQEGVTFDAYNVYMREGMTGSSTIEEVFRLQLNKQATEEDCQRIYKTKADYFVSLGQAPEMKDVDTVLECVMKYHLEPFLVTGSGQRTLIDKLNHSFPNVFKKENMVTAFDVKKGKPDPEPYLMALKKGNLNANQAIVIENAPMGVRSAKAAGIFTIAVNTGILKDEELWKEGADLVYPSMKELRKELDTIIEMSSMNLPSNHLKTAK